MPTKAPIIALKQLAGNPPTHLYPIQEMFAPYVHVINTAWFIIWCITACTLIVQLFREYRRTRR